MESVIRSVRPTGSKSDSEVSSGAAWAEPSRPDLLRRFTPTPHVANLRLMGRTLRLETNHEAVLDLALRFFERHQYGNVGQPEFVWRVVCEADSRVVSADVEFVAFSDSGLRYVNLGQRSFLAVDTDKREAMGYLADRFVESAPELRNNRPLDILFCMTAPSLGLTAMSGGCVGVEDQGVMVFGPPNSGKTTACYLAAKLGMEFHADQAVFLDMGRDDLHVWGDLFPAVFRPETLEFLPELRESTRYSAHAGLAFYYFDKHPLQARWARPVAPVCSIFLERGNSGKPQLNEISPEDAVVRLRACLLFPEDERFDAQVNAALHALARKPVYSLQYGSDPRVAASFIEKMQK